jgi:hypothetical protein
VSHEQGARANASDALSPFSAPPTDAKVQDPRRTRALTPPAGLQGQSDTHQGKERHLLRFSGVRAGACVER